MQVLNHTQFNSTKELLAEGFDEFLVVFLTELEQAIDVLMHQSDDTKRIAHSQKSTCALLGAEELQQQFSAIEELASQNQDTLALISQLPEQYISLKKSIN